MMQKEHFSTERDYLLQTSEQITGNEFLTQNQTKMASKIYFNLLLIGSLFCLAACKQTEPQSVNKDLPNDKKATSETVALYQNLKNLSGKGILFGQQDAVLYGVGRNHPDSGYCDIKDVCGAYPAVYGWDIGHIMESTNVDSVRFTKMKRMIKEAYSRGGIITLSWHEKNPAGTGNVNDLTPVAKRILPGGDLNQHFKELLNAAGNFFTELKDEKGNPVPIIFRPFHEHNGDWFWWGTKSFSEQEYIDVFRYTENYLRDTLNIHQLLYAISPDRSRMNPNQFEHDMLYAYPGDDYIDIMGFDNYWDVGAVEIYDKTVSRQKQDSFFLAGLHALVKLAMQKNKIPALTETGCGTMKEINWYTSRILNPLKSDSIASRIAWLLVWRNFSTSHFYAPYPGHPSASDFISFKNDSLIMFEDERPVMYKLK
ncbi:MAG: glycosyl hydrolase [Bacteroidales bacterium]